MTAALIEQLRAEQAMLGTGRRDEAFASNRHANDRARSELLRTEEQLLDCVQKTPAPDHWKAIEDSLARANQALRGFEQTTDWSGTLEFDAESCLIDCDQRVSRDLLVKSKDAPNVTPLRKLMDDIAELQHSLQFRPDRGGPLIPDTLVRGSKLLERVDTGLRDSCLSSAPFVKPMEDVTAVVRNATQLPGLTSSEALVELDERLRRLLFDIEATQKAQRELFADGEVKDGEAKYYELLRLQEVAAQTITTKFSALDLHVHTVIESFLRTVEAVHSRAEAACTTLLEDGTQLKRRCQADLTNLTTSVSKVSQEHEEYINRYQCEMERSNLFLKDTQRKQESAWTKIQALERELGKLAKERYEEIQTRIANFETAEKHKVSFSNFTSFTKRHREALQATIKNCEMQEYLAQLARDFVRGRCETLVMCANDRKNEVEDFRSRFHEEYLANFRAMYLTNGELVYKKQRTAEQLEAQIQTTEARFQLCMETWDPEAKVYSQQKKDLVKLRDDMSEQIGKLEQNQQLYLEWFEPTEKYLQLTDRPFVHPKDELDRRNEERAGKLIEYKQLMEAAEDDEDDEDYLADNAAPQTLAITDNHPPESHYPPSAYATTPARPYAPRPPMSGRAAPATGSRFPSLYRDVSPEAVH
eukprot:TRINITY_DN21067_c0_g1_i4.p1 TRINITY_DN21067_c0_g1~~TRINITY_DN21067_c0_g1_i4.p1  ORF type:complete len:644 (+),score=165.29 TRINITY_DN21067_c0_g1_i4:98-2029(+)